MDRPRAFNVGGRVFGSGLQASSSHSVVVVCVMVATRAGVHSMSSCISSSLLYGLNSKYVQICTSLHIPYMY